MKTSEEKESNAAHAAVLEKELKANDRLHKELTETRAAAEETERKLKKNIRELQVAIQTIEEKAGYREDNLRQDIAVRRQISISICAHQSDALDCRHCKNACKLLKLTLMRFMQALTTRPNHCFDKLKFFKPKSTS